MPEPEDEAQEQLRAAIELHRRGERARAEELYRRVLAHHPQQPDAHHNLAILRLQSGAPTREVLGHFRTAWQENPDHPQYGISLLRALVLEGADAEAEAVHAAARRRGVSLPRPSVFRPTPHAPAGQRADPVSPATVAALERARAAGDLGALRKLAERVAASSPEAAIAWKHLAIALEGLGDASGALAHARRAVRADWADMEALLLAARLARQAGLPAEASRLYSLVVKRRPDDARSWAALAQSHLAANQFLEAKAAADRALKIDDGLGAAWTCLGTALLALGESWRAEQCLGKAVAVDVDSPDAFNALGRILLESGRKAAAEQLCRGVLDRQPRHREALYTLGTLQMEGGRLRDARQSLARLAELSPERLDVRSTLLFIDNYLEDLPARERLEDTVRFGRDAAPRSTAMLPAWQGESRPGRLRVGLVSPDLRTHPVGYFIEGILASPPSRAVDWVAYSSAPYSDKLTARLRSRFADWRNLNGLADADCARLIRTDGVHVLIDLAGHTIFNRLPVFAWKAAPVQASWLGYFATTGLSEIDYLLADDDCVPAELEGQFVERVWRLPTRLCFTPPNDAPELRPVPCARGAPVVFGCFQAYPKITDEMLALWSRLLASLPGAKLRFQNAQLAFEDERLALLGRLARVGIDSSRVELAGFVSRQRYLEDLGTVDILLDTYPYPGGTTTCEALWMGVPTVTLAGNSMISRQGLSILAAAGLRDWVAHSPDEYVRLAARKAQTVSELVALRQGLRAKLPSTLLFDANRFASSLVSALRAMWERATANETPRQ